jgi:hypothetical protein
VQRRRGEPLAELIFLATAIGKETRLQRRRRAWDGRAEQKSVRPKLRVDFCLGFQPVLLGTTGWHSLGLPYVIGAPFDEALTRCQQIACDGVSFLGDAA